MTRDIDKCVWHDDLAEGLKEANGKLDKLVARLGSGDVVFGNLRTRLKLIEVIVYGACGVIGAAVIVAVLALALKK